MGKKTVVEIVELAGGGSKVASELSISYEAVRQWGEPKRGVPSKHVLRLAKMSGVPPIEILEASDRQRNGIAQAKATV